MRTHTVTPETFRYMLEWCWASPWPSKVDLLSAPSVPEFHGHVLGLWV